MRNTAFKRGPGGPAPSAPLAFLVSLALGGCAANSGALAPQPVQLRDLSPADADARAELVRRDPLAYIRQVYANCRTLEHYTLKFTRQERRGLFQRLSAPEHVACWFRREPFSVRMKWLDDDSRYGEMVYVAGRHKDLVHFVTRRPLPLLKPPPQVNTVDLQTPVAIGETKRPLSQFGLERLMERTVAAIDEAGADVIVRYEGLVQLPEGGPTAHYIHIVYPPARYAVPIQELYVDVATDLPAGTRLKRPNGELDAQYFYVDIDDDAEISDDDFLLPAERGATRGASSGKANP